MKLNLFIIDALKPKSREFFRQGCKNEGKNCFGCDLRMYAAKTEQKRANTATVYYGAVHAKQFHTGRP